MACAAAYGRLEMLQWILEKAKTERGWWVWEPNLILYALRQRNFHLMGFLWENYPQKCTTVPFSELVRATKADDVELVAWYYDHGYEFERKKSSGAYQYVMDRASSLAMLQLLHGYRKVRCSSSAMDRAARLGNLAMVEFLHENRYEGCMTDAMDCAASYGHLEVVQFLDEHRSEGCTSQAMDGAARYGHFEVVQFLHENRSEGCTSEAMRFAVANEHLDVVTFLLEHRVELRTPAALNYVNVAARR